MTGNLLQRPVVKPGMIFWGMFLILVLVPLEGLFLSGLQMAHRSIIEGASFIIRQRLEGTLFTFRSLLDPDTVLTRRLEHALGKARNADGPQRWHAAMVSGLGDFPAGSYDLLLTDGRSLIPAADGYDPGLLSAFLASMTARAESLVEIGSAVKYLRATQKEFESFGNERLSIMRKIDLPSFPSISNRIFDNSWMPDRITSVLATPRNTWAAFGKAGGRVGELSGWRYLMLFHRQNLPPSFLKECALREAWKEALPVDLPGFAPGLPRPVVVTASASQTHIRVTRADERFGVLTAAGELPNRLWVLFFLGVIANLAFGLAAAAASFRYFLCGNLTDVPVGRKITFGLLGGMGLPLLLVLYTVEGTQATRILRAAQGDFLEMEASTQRLDAEFIRSIDRVSEDHRRDLKAIAYPWDAEKAVPQAEVLASRHMVSLVQIISSEGVRLVSRGPFPWSPFRAGFQGREERERKFRDWCRRGYFLLNHELDLLALDTPETKPLSPQRLRSLAMAVGRNPSWTINPKLFEMIARRVCASLNKTTAETGPGKVDPGAMLDIAFKGKEAELIQEILANLGRIHRFTIGNSSQMIYMGAIRDRQGRAQALGMVFQRLSDLGEQFFYDCFRRPFERGRFSLLALSRFYGKSSFGEGLGVADRDSLERILADPGQSIRCIREDENGVPRLYFGIRSMVLSEYIYVVSMPLDTLVQEAARVRTTVVLVLGFLLFLAIGISWWLRKLLVTPLGELQQLVARMAEGTTTETALPSAIGEIGELSDLFGRTLITLRQMDLARTVQETLLPTAPVRFGGFEMAGKSVMMSQVGGDYFDLIPRGGGRFLVVVGDVSGHGLSAAIVVSMVKSAFLLLAETTMETNEMLVAINDVMFKTLARKKLMTCLLGSLDTETGELRYSNAGHNFPWLGSSSGIGSFVKQTNLPLGSMRNRPYKIDSVTIPPGGTLVMFSDGITEAADPANVILGYERLGEFLRKSSCGASPESATEDLLDFVRAYSRGVPWQDDVTVLVVKRGMP